MIPRLAGIHAAMTDYLRQACSEDSVPPYARVSEFWRRLFDKRPPLPDLNELLTFRRSVHLYGTGGLPEPDMAAERRLHRNSAKMVLGRVPAEFVTTLEEPLFGSPMIFDYNGLLCSENFLMNARKAYIYARAAARYMPDGKGLNVCDIGGGWGAVGYQLHRCLDVAAFTDIDLPGNLFFAGIFLPVVLDDKRVRRVLPGDRIEAPEPGTLYFSLPQAIESLGGKYDLIVNSLSLQEMDLETARAYVRWTKSHLAPGGLFISINRHGLAGVERAFDFGFTAFTIHEIFPIESYNFFMGAAYVTIMGLDENGITYDEPVMNALCDLMQLGLDRDLEEMCTGFADGSLTSERSDFLTCIEPLFRRSDIRDKMDLMRNLDKEPGFAAHRAVVRYIEGLLCLASHSHAEALERLTLSLDAGLAGSARAKAATLCCAVLRELGGTDTREYRLYLSEADRHAPYWSEQIRRDLDAPIVNYKADIARKLSFDLPPMPPESRN